MAEQPRGRRWGRQSPVARGTGGTDAPGHAVQPPGGREHSESVGRHPLIRPGPRRPAPADMLPAGPRRPGRVAVPPTFSRPRRRPAAACARAGPARVRTGHRRCRLHRRARRDRRGGRGASTPGSAARPTTCARAAPDPTGGRRPSAAAAPRPPTSAAFRDAPSPLTAAHAASAAHRQERFVQRRGRDLRATVAVPAAVRPLPVQQPLREPARPGRRRCPSRTIASRAPPCCDAHRRAGHRPPGPRPGSGPSARRCPRTPAGSASPARCPAPGREAAPARRPLRVAEVGEGLQDPVRAVPLRVGTRPPGCAGPSSRPRALWRRGSPRAAAGHAATRRPRRGHRCGPSTAATGLAREQVVDLTTDVHDPQPRGVAVTSLTA